MAAADPCTRLVLFLKDANATAGAAATEVQGVLARKQQRAAFFREALPALLDRAFGLSAASATGPWLEMIAGEGGGGYVVDKHASLSNPKVLRRLGVRRMVDVLSPDGPLMEAIRAADRDALTLFEFPHACLPPRTRSMLGLGPSARGALERLPHYSGTVCAGAAKNDGSATNAEPPGARVEVSLFSYFVFWFLVYCSRHGQGVVDPGSATTDVAGSLPSAPPQQAAARQPTTSRPRAVAGAPAPFPDVDVHTGPGSAAAGANPSGASHAATTPSSTSYPVPTYDAGNFPTPQCAHPCRELLLRYIQYYAPAPPTPQAQQNGAAARFDPDSEHGRHSRIFFHALADFLLSDSDEAVEWRVSLEGAPPSATMARTPDGVASHTGGLGGGLLAPGGALQAAAVGSAAFGATGSPFDMPLGTIPSMPWDAMGGIAGFNTAQGGAPKAQVEPPRLSSFELPEPGRAGAIDAVTLVVRALQSLHVAGPSGKGGVKDLLKGTEAVERIGHWLSDNITRLGASSSPGGADASGASSSHRPGLAAPPRSRMRGNDASSSGTARMPQLAPKLPPRAAGPAPGIIAGLSAFTRDLRVLMDTDTAASKVLASATPGQGNPTMSGYDAFGARAAASTAGAATDVPWFVQLRRPPPLLCGAWPGRAAASLAAVPGRGADKSCEALVAKDWHPLVALYAPLYRFIMRTYQRWDAASQTSMSSIVELHLAIICPWDMHSEQHELPSVKRQSGNAGAAAGVGGSGAVTRAAHSVSALASGGASASPTTGAAAAGTLLSSAAQQVGRTLFGGGGAGMPGAGTSGSGGGRSADFDESGLWDSYVLLHAPFYAALRTMAELTCRRCAASTPERAARNLARVLASVSMTPLRALRLLKLDECHAMAAHIGDAARKNAAAHFVASHATVGYVPSAAKAQEVAVPVEQCEEFGERLYAHWRLCDERRVSVMKYLAKLEALTKSRSQGLIGAGTGITHSEGEGDGAMSLESLDVVAAFGSLADEGGVAHLLRALNAFLKTDRAKGGAGKVEYLKRYADRLENWSMYFARRLGVATDAAAGAAGTQRLNAISEPVSPVGGAATDARRLVFSNTRNSHGGATARAQGALHRPLSDLEVAPLCELLIRASESLNKRLQLGDYAPADPNAGDGAWDVARRYLVRRGVSVDLRHLSEVQSLGLLSCFLAVLHSRLLFAPPSLFASVFVVVALYAFLVAASVARR